MCFDLNIHLKNQQVFNMDNRLKGLFIFVVIIVLISMNEYRWNHINNLIDSSGTDIHAKIIRASFARGYNIRFVYKYNGREYENTDNVTQFHCQAGDSIIIRILPNDPGGNVLIKEKIRIPIPTSR